MFLVIDNYDSFTYNLVQRLGELGVECLVKRNDEVTPDEVEAIAPTHIIISPGPCTPAESGVSVDIVRRFAPHIPILGVCLGHQCIAAAFGGRIVRAARLMHGKTSQIHHDGLSVYSGLPSPFVATRYHSLTVEENSLPDCLLVVARSERGELMGIRHREFPAEGVQFHPESFLTPDGLTLIRNFVDRQSVPGSGTD